jgi:hypothetical protein
LPKDSSAKEGGIIESESFSGGAKHMHLHEEEWDEKKKIRRRKGKDGRCLRAQP